MAPKGALQSPSRLGTVEFHGGQWRLSANIGTRKVHGPMREDKSVAESDLQRARTAQTQIEYQAIIRQMQYEAVERAGRQWVIVISQ